jgi:Transposase DDE domain
VGDPETLIVDSTLLPVLHPRQVPRSVGLEGAAWVRWGSFSVYGVELHVLCATNRVPLSYELTAANASPRSAWPRSSSPKRISLGGDLARRLLGDLAYRSEALAEAMAGAGILLVTGSSAQRGKRQRVEIALASLKRVFGLGETPATSLVGLTTRIASKIAAYTYAFLVNRRLGRAQGRIKELWA